MVLEKKTEGDVLQLEMSYFVPFPQVRCLLITQRHNIEYFYTVPSPDYPGGTTHFLEIPVTISGLRWLASGLTINHASIGIIEV